MSTSDALTPFPRPMRADARRNYDLLLAAAGAAFAEHGMEASLEDIARRAGVGIGTLYRHFPTRESLAEAVYRARIEALREEAESLLAAPSPEEALAVWLRSLVKFGSTQRGLALFLKTALREDGSNLAWCKETMRAAGGALLLRAQQSGAIRPDLEVSDLLRLAHAISWAVEPPTDGDRTDRYLSLMLDGLRRQERTQEEPRPAPP